MPEQSEEDILSMPSRMTEARSIGVSLLLILFALVLIAGDRRGLLKGFPSEPMGQVGYVVALCGLMGLIHVWSLNRFRVTLSRFMIAVAIFAVILQGVLVYRSWVIGGLPKPGGGTTRTVTKRVL